jgi:hypothetical protein
MVKTTEYDVITRIVTFVITYLFPYTNYREYLFSIKSKGDFYYGKEICN